MAKTLARVHTHTHTHTQVVLKKINIIKKDRSIMLVFCDTS